jgi:GNAT superfamily N-acetyltransferase
MTIKRDVLSSCSSIGDGASQLVIRPFEPTDHDAAKDLILQGLGEHFGFIDFTKNPDLNDIQGTYVESGHVFLVAIVDGRLVGTGALTQDTETRGRLVRISVDRQGRRSGLGSRIVKDLLQVARSRGYHEVCLETERGWIEVIRFYHTLGFGTVEEQDGRVHMSIGI